MKLPVKIEELLCGRAAKGELIKYRAGIPMPFIARFDEKKVAQIVNFSYFCGIEEKQGHEN